MKEGQRLEWKESWRDEFCKTICGFANADGGVLIVGRDNKGKIVGVSNAPKLLEDLPNKIRDLLGIMVDVNLREAAGRDVLEIVVEPYPNPISYRGEYYVRSGSTTQALKGAPLDKFLLRKQGRHWDAVPVPRVAAKDLDPKAFASFREQAVRSKRLGPGMLQGSRGALLDRLRLVEGAYLKRAAVLLFHPDPEKFVSGAFVKIGFFENDADLRYQDEVHGDLFAQVQQTVEILKAKYLKAWISYEGLQRIESYPVPEGALREAVLNAVIHKDYGSGIPIQISVYPDKLMIWNPGELPPRWTVKKLLAKHASVPFNPDVARTFFRAGQIEAWGRGFERMVAECVEAKTPKPQARYEATGLWMTFPFPPVETPPTDQVTDQVSDQVTDPVERLVLAVSEGAHPASTVQRRLHLRHRPTFRENYLSPALRLGLLEMTRPETPKSRLQQYRLTDAGRTLLARLMAKSGS